ncbi:ceramidase [Rhodobium gokarnense]|uniref:Ceramidase n=1 Tax=Rhodobium gokarnense TaxID=364296 RepID=A0ABT3HCZ6_9HYPH|nr:ceramidase [Rhodobium gokarnense]MCW2308245.1 hypothetical protein [Rhodobium gokarnense]
MEQINVYCERTDFGFWAEPVNALTNLAFILVAVWALANRPRGGRSDWLVVALAGLVALVGIGSFLFHTLATRWAGLADVIPITAFIYLFFFTMMVRLFRLHWVLSLIATVAFFLAARYATPLFRDIVGYSAGYVPPLIGMVGAGIALMLARRPGGPLLLAAAGLFAVSLTFRILDGPTCGTFPLGTHFLWHLFNAMVLYTLLRAVMSPSAALERNSG